MDSPVLTPEPMSDEFAACLMMTKKELLGASGVVGEVVQTGGVYVDGAIDIPKFDAAGASSEPEIETFVVDAGGECVPTGANTELINRFLPAVAQMVEQVSASLARTGVTIDSPSYVTVSITPLSAVVGTPHFDDDLYVDEAGVGIVAIAANIAGPRIACIPLKHGPARSSLPLTVDPQVMDDFDSGLMATQQAEPDRVVMFPQFAQLHAGPVLTQHASVSLRSLLVFRAGTRPG